MELARELETYKAHQTELVLSNEGGYVLIKGDQIQAYSNYEEALSAGFDQYGLEPFLVKQVCRAEPVHYFSRNLPL
jgi:hypothetical protein